MITKFFRNRAEAGRFLAGALSKYANDPKLAVLALPRGGVPVAYEVAQALNAPLDIFLVRKLIVPGYPELAMGTITSGGVRLMNAQVVDCLRIPDRIVSSVIKREESELKHREKLYRSGRPPLDLRGRVLIVIDDGMTTGWTMRTAVRALGYQEPEKIIVAVPLGIPEACDYFAQELGTTCVCAVRPQPFDGVGLWYTDSEEISDDCVRELLTQASIAEVVSIGGSAKSVREGGGDEKTWNDTRVNTSTPFCDSCSELDIHQSGQ
jgi:predicted phosphoribosyltransferase